MIKRKTAREIELMRIAGRIAAEALSLAGKMTTAGTATRSINRAVHEYIISVNDEVIHGIPGLRKLLNGDIISIDLGVCFKRFHGDAARTFAVGKISEKHQQLLDVTERSFFEGMIFCTAENRLHDISNAIDDYVKPFGFGIVSEWCGHGIGRQVHEDPQIPHTRQKKRGPRLQRGMTLAIEPMINLGTSETNMSDDTWTVITRDGEYSAHYENTVLITDGQPEILTL